MSGDGASQRRTADHGRVRPLPSSSGLPAELSSFVGRQGELAELASLLASHRLVTLVGAGGMGKTRLARRLAADASGRAVRVAFVDLSAITTSGGVAEAIADAVGVVDDPGSTLAETVASIMDDRPALIVLDNCEQIIEACATEVAALLAAIPGLRVLATSREPLQLMGERVQRVGGLKLDSTPDHERAGLPEAAELFSSRARETSPGLAVEQQDIDIVLHIVRRLDGMPLAIELAAAKTRALSLAEIASRLDDRFDLLDGGFRAVRPGHQTLRATLDSSYDLLDESARRALRWCSTFVGGFTGRAAADVLRQGSVMPARGRDAENSLASLVDRSLLVPERVDGELRFRMLETVRHYGLDRLRAAGDESRAFAAHLAWASEQARGLEHRVIHGGAWEDRARWIVRVNDDVANLRAALGFAIARGRAGDAVSIALALRRIWAVQGAPNFLPEAEALLGLAALNPAERAHALGVTAEIALAYGDDRAERFAIEGMDLARRSGTPAALCESSRIAARSRLTGGAIDGAEAVCRLGLAAAEEADLDFYRGLMRGVGCQIAYARRDLDAAVAHAEAAIACFERVGDRWAATVTATDLARIARRRGDLGRAHELLAGCLAMLRATGSAPMLADALFLLGRICAERGEPGDAARWASEAAEIFERVGRRALAERCRAFLHRMSSPIDRPVRATMRVEFGEGTLTERQREIVTLVVGGRSNREIAEALYLSKRTVDRHMENILRQLGVRSRTEVVRLAVEHGWVPRESRRQ